MHMKTEMTTEKLMSLPKPFLLDGAKQCAENANDLYTGGIELSKSKKYGAANSLLILAAEEYVKAGVLIIGFCGFTPDFKVEQIFVHHNAKHKQAKKMFPVLRFVSTLSKLVKIKEIKSSNRLHTIFQKALAVLSLFVNSKEKKFVTWWNKADNQKNIGLYVDYRQSKWQLPSQIEEADFMKTKSMVEPFVTAFKFIDKLEGDDYKLLPDYL